MLVCLLTQFKHRTAIYLKRDLLSKPKPTESDYIIFTGEKGNLNDLLKALRQVIEHHEM